MTDLPSRSEVYCYRIIGAQPELSDLLAKENLPRFSSKPHFEFENTSVVCFDLEQTTADQLADYLKELLIRYPLYISKGIYCSLVTDLRHDGLTIPYWVVNFLEKLGGGTIDFSFFTTVGWDGSPDKL